MNQNDSLSYDVTSLFMAVKKTKDLELAVNDLLTTLSKINLDGLELKTASNLDNTITEINSVKSVELSELSGNLEKTKILAEQGDENINTLFSTMDNLTSGEITAEEAIVEIMNNQNLTFEAVKMYDEVLNEYTKELTGIKNQIDELTMENSGYVVDELSAALWEEDVNKKTESLNKKYNDLAAATSILKQLRDYLYQEAAMAYMEYPDFDEVSSGRIASYTTDFVETAVGLYEESYGYYKYNFYDENGNKIDDVSYLEQAIYFNSNNIAIAQTDDKNRILEDLDYIKYLNEDERKVLLYLERTNNENYNEFYTFEKGIANQRHGEELANEFINELENNNSNDLQLFGSLIEEGLSDGVDNFFGGLNNLFSADGIVSPEQYKSMYILNYVNEKYEEETILKYIQTGTYEISNSIGNMLPSVFVGTITANPLLGATTMGLSAAGNAREQGLQMGMTDVQSWFYGAMTGLSEAGLQYLLGGIPGLSNLEKIGGGTGFKAFLSRMASEGIEESTQALLDPLFLTITTGKPYEVDMNEVLKSGIYGVITAGLMNGGQLVLNGAVCKVDSLSQGKISELISKFQGKDLTDPKIQQELAEDLSNNNEEIVEEEMAESELDEILSEDEGEVLVDYYGSEFRNILGENLRSWIPTINSEINLRTCLVNACSRVGNSISSIKKCFDILNAMSKYYESARELESKITEKGEIFNTYRTHGVVHVIDVLTQTINSYAAFKNSGIKDMSLDVLTLAAVMHDTGMSGGKQLILGVNKNKEITIDVQEKIDSNGKTYRESHSFNSAVNIINEYETLRKFGYSDLQIAEASLLTFAHSKSNSGLNPLSGNVGGWSFAIQALSKATENTGFDIVDVLATNNVLLSTDINKSQSTISVKCPTNKVVGNIGTYSIDENWLKVMGYEALCLRLGDALTNNDNAGTNQYGKPIIIKNDYSNQKDINQVLNNSGIDSSLSFDDQLTKLIDGLLETDDSKKIKLETLAEYEAGDIAYEVDGVEWKKSQQYVLGENNQEYKIENASNGTVEVIVSVKNSEAIPFCTLFAIDERVGELNSKGPKLFDITSDSGIKMVIEIDSSTSKSVKELYNAYSEFYAKQTGTVPIEIREK